jgi:hypothetical protein
MFSASVFSSSAENPASTSVLASGLLSSALALRCTSACAGRPTAIDELDVDSEGKLYEPQAAAVFATEGAVEGRLFLSVVLAAACTPFASVPPSASTHSKSSSSCTAVGLRACR